MRIPIIIIVISLFINNVYAQQARVKQYKTALAGKVVLRDVDDKYNATVASVEAPEVDDEADMAKLRDVKAWVHATYPYKENRSAKKTTSAVPKPILGKHFIADSVSGIPPDNYSAISKGNQVVCVMNDRIAIHDTSGAYLSRKTLEFYSNTLGLTSTNDFRYDPKVVYDPIADKFISIILDGENQYNYVILGFSETNDPGGTWNFYKFYGDYNNDTTWFDYPAISITKNEVFFTGNKIKYDSSWQAGFTQTLIYQVRKSDGYSGAATLSYQVWDSIEYNNTPLRCLYPLNPGDSVLGPSACFLSNRNFDPLNDSVFLITVPDTLGSGNTNLTVTPLVSSLSYGVPPDARQPDTTVSLATNDGRILGGFIEGNEIQFVCTSVNPLNGASAVYLGKISNYNTTPALTGQIFGVDSLDLGYPNISYAGNYTGSNSSIISFDYSGPHTYPGFGAIFYDGANFSDMLNIKSGTTKIWLIGGKEQRWGDYSGSQPQWGSTGVVWAEGIFSAPNPTASFTYGNYIAQLIAPYRGLGVPQSPPPVTNSKLYPNPAWEFVSFDFNVDQEQVFGFIIYDAQGKVVDKMLDKYCRSGKNIIQFDIAPLAPGTYFLKAVGTKGEQVAVHTFVRR